MAVFDVISNGPITAETPGGLPGALGVDTLNSGLYVGTPPLLEETGKGNALAPWTLVTGTAGFQPITNPGTTILATGNVLTLEGTGTIQTITPPATWPFGTPLYLVCGPAATVVLGVEGNIGIPGNQPFTMTAGTSVMFLWGGLGWYPITPIGS